MAKKNKVIKIRLNQDLAGFLSGQVIKIGPGFYKHDKYWVNKIKDSEIDHAITVIEEKEISESRNVSVEKAVAKTKIKPKTNKSEVSHGNK